MALQKDAEKNMDEECELRGNFKENVDKRNTQNTQKEIVEIAVQIMRNEGLENVTLRGHIETKTCVNGWQKSD